MDSTGWHALHRSKKEDARLRAPQKGPDGRFQPVEEIGPLRINLSGPSNEHYVPRPPPPPPKDGVRTQDNLRQAPPEVFDGAHATNVISYTASQLAELSAVERSRYSRVAQMNPPLQLMVGPLLRYDTVDQDGVWRGAALIVCADAGSYYEPYPYLMYVWDPDVPTQITRNSTPGGRAGQSLELPPHPADPFTTPGPSLNPAHHGPNAVFKQSIGQEIYVHVGSSGTYTFWRFMIEIPLGPREVKVSYSVNHGQQVYFHVPGRNQNMRWAAYSCNGFSAGVNPNEFCGPGFQSGYDPVWSDLLKKHAEAPFHVLVGGGDQLYCDGVVREPELQEWVNMPKSEKKKTFRITEEMRVAIDRFYFNHYCHTFRSGAFARANSSIPMLNMLDDHDLIDGFGSYPDELMSSPVFNTIGSRGYFFFLLFQCFINLKIDGRDETKHPFKSLIIGGDGPFIPFPSHSFLTWMGPQIWMLLLDCRAERKLDQVCSRHSYRQVFQRLYALGGNVEHLVVQLGIPIAYPRMVFLESMLESKLNPLAALGRSGSLGLSNFVNKFNADPELLDDLNDHWTAKHHKTERNWFIKQLQMFAKAKRIRVTFISGDVHCAAVGVLKTLHKSKEPEISPPQDYRYMLNVVSSAIVNTPPPAGVLAMVSSLATKTHRTMHHVNTDEGMIPLFDKDAEGRPLKHKYIMGNRNWCAVEWDPNSGDLIFDIRVEMRRGYGKTTGYTVRVPPPRWIPQISES